MYQVRQNSKPNRLAFLTDAKVIKCVIKQYFSNKFRFLISIPTKKQKKTIKIYLRHSFRPIPPKTQFVKFNKKKEDFFSSIMSSPLYKHTNENSSTAKQRKIKSTNAVKSTTNLDSRTELADLIKRKAEIAVSEFFILSKFNQFLRQN